VSKPEPKPHKVVCISMYLTDLELASQMISGLKRDGFTNMNRSRLIRLALEQFDASKLTPEDNYR
jgi:hypothetical protein